MRGPQTYINRSPDRGEQARTSLQGSRTRVTSSLLRRAFVRYDPLTAATDAVDRGSAVLELGDELLKQIARELVDSVRRNESIDWSEKEQVRARMRATIRRLLNRYGYPPDKQLAAIKLVMHQAEMLARVA
jgi:Domain of unknown function (DUF3387)